MKTTVQNQIMIFENGKNAWIQNDVTENHFNGAVLPQT